MADGPAIGTAYLRVAGDFSQVNSQVVGLFSSERFKKYGKAAGVGLAAGVAAAGVGKILYDIGEQFDAAYDRITVRTGATGKQLTKLQSDFRAVVKGVPTDFDTASRAVGALNQRLDVTGKPLRNLTKQFTELSRITETDVEDNIQNVTRAFGDWEVKTREQSRTLDYFFKASQASGASVSDLASQVVQFGAPLRQVGFRLEEAVSMFAQFEEAGVNTQTMMPGLRMALRSFLERDIDPRKGLQRTFEGIESGTIEASKALEIFGARAGADMVEAIKQGRFDLDKFTESIADNDETIRKAGRRTMDFSEHWQKFKNNVMVGLEPLATKVFTGIGDAMKDITKAFKQDGLEGVIDVVTEKISAAIPKMLEAGKDMAVAVVKGFLDSGPWGALALGGIIAKLLGGVKALSAATTAGSTVAQRFGAGFSAGLTRFGIAAAAVGVAQFGKELGDLLGGASAAEKVGKAWGEDVVSSVSAELGELESRHAVGEIRRITASTQAVIEKWEEAGVEIPEEMREVIEGGERMADRIAAQSDKVRESIRAMRKGFHDNLGEILRDTDEITDKITDKFGTSSAKSKNLLRDNYAAATRAIKSAMKNQQISVAKGQEAIEDLLKKQMKTYGIKNPDAMIAEIGSKTTAAAALNRQRGGLINIGEPAGDSVPAMLEKGEYVLNREAVKAVGRSGLDDLNFRVAKRFATGGWVDPAGPGTGVVNPAIAKVVGAWSKRYDAAINYGYDPGGGHVSPGHNVTGTATDTGPAAGWTSSATALFERGLRAVEGKVDQILYGTAGIGTPYDNHGRGNHAHIEWGMHPDVVGSIAARLKLPRFKAKIKGALGSAQGLNNLASAVEKTMTRRIAGMGGGPDIGSQSAGGIFSKSELMKLWTGVNRGLADPNVMAAVALAESGGDPRAVGHDPGGTLGLGLWQITTGFNDDLIAKYGGRNAMFNPATNAKAAADIFRRQGLGAWYAPWQQYLQRGGLAHLATGGSAVSGPGMGGKTGNVPLPRLRSRLQAIKRKIGLTDERIDIAQQLAGLSTSPGGSDLSASERDQQARLLERRLGLFEKQASIARAGISLSKRVKGSPAGFREALLEAAGLTGKGGEIFSTKIALGELRATPLAGAGGISIAQLVEIADAARLGLFPRAPVMHGGGIYRAPIPGGEGPAILKDGEEVIPRGGGGSGPLEFVVTNWDEGKGFIRRQAGAERQQADRAIDLRARAGV